MPLRYIYTMVHGICYINIYALVKLFQVWLQWDKNTIQYVATYVAMYVYMCVVYIYVFCVYMCCVCACVCMCVLVCALVCCYYSMCIPAIGIALL